MMLRCHRCRTRTSIVIRDGSGKADPLLCHPCYEKRDAHRQADRERELARERRLLESIPEAFR